MDFIRTDLIVQDLARFINDYPDKDHEEWVLFIVEGRFKSFNVQELRSVVAKIVEELSGHIQEGSPMLTAVLELIEGMIAVRILTS